MDLKSKFYNIFKALNPYNYSELAEHKFSQVLKYYLFIMIFSLCVMFILFIPFLFYAGTYVSTSVSHFDTLSVNSDFSLKDSFDILSDPVIRFESEDKNVTNELVLITPKSVSYKRYLLFGSQREIPLGTGVDVASSARAKALISLGIIFIFPSLFFWSIIFSIFYFSIIVLITYILVLLFTGLFRLNYGLFKLLKACVFASTIFIMLQLILMPFFRLFLIPLVAYWLLIVIVLFVWKDQHVEHGHEYSAVSDSKSKDIFGDKHGSSSSKSSSKIEARDEYDVDEHGNLKSSSHSLKKHHVDDNDGYVELK